MSALTPKAYGRMAEELNGYGDRYGPAAILVWAIDYYKNKGAEKEAKLVEQCCRGLGVQFKQKTVMGDNGDEYVITMMPDGKMTCNCKGFIFSKIPNKYHDDKKWCKHLERYSENEFGWDDIVVDLQSLPPMPDDVVGVRTGTNKKRRFKMFDE